MSVLTSLYSSFNEGDDFSSQRFVEAAILFVLRAKATGAAAKWYVRNPSVDRVRPAPCSAIQQRRYLAGAYLFSPSRRITAVVSILGQSVGIADSVGEQARGEYLR